MTDLNNAIAMNEFDATTHFRKGLVLFRLRQIDDAVAALDRALKLAPHFPHALRIRARLYREMDKPDAAVADMVHAIAIDATILSETMPALRIAGYWRSKDDPTMLTPALEDAIRACMLDKRCN